MKNKKRRGVFIYAVMPIVYLFFSLLVTYLVCANGFYPQGSDCMYYLYRGDLMYQSISEGKFFLAFNPDWYNGVVLWNSPSIGMDYILAFCQFLAGGNVEDGYLIFVFLLYYLSALIWLGAGVRNRRMISGIFFGFLWLLMPSNLYVLFVEGGLARGVILALLPAYVDRLYYAIHNLKPSHVFQIGIFTACLMLLHVGMTMLVLIAGLLFVLLTRGEKKEGQSGLAIVGACITGILLSGFSLIPFLSGGAAKSDYSEVRDQFFQALSVTFHPFLRMKNQNSTIYFPVVLLVILLIGAFFSAKHSRKIFLLAGALLFCTSKLAGKIFSYVPGGDYLWMIWLMPVCVCLIFFALMKWEQLKLGFRLAFLILLCADIMPSLSMIYGNHTFIYATQRHQEMADATLLSRAKEITQQRLLVLDDSLESVGMYLAADWEGRTSLANGYRWREADTSQNISFLELACQTGRFAYLFDRSVELGCDTILMNEAQIDPSVCSVEEMDDHAKKLGYELVETNRFYRLYHMDRKGQWGVKSKYKGIAIGTKSGNVSIDFPSLLESDQTNLNEYRFEDLKQYELILLVDFTYDDKAKAEELIKKLSDNGNRIVILADGIPESRQSGSQSFLGVTCNKISFTNGFPELDTKNGLLDTDLFPIGSENWNTVYVDGLDEVWGSVDDNDVILDFMGTKYNDSIVFIGLNLTFFYSLTEDAGVGQLLEEAYRTEMKELPRRNLYPIEISYEGKDIIIHSDYDDINTTLAYLDLFSGEQDLTEKNHCLYVNSGDTVIHLNLVYWKRGIVISVLGLAWMIVLYFWVRFLRVVDKQTTNV